VDISVGQVDALLSGHNAAFFAEQDQLLVTGLQVSPLITVDDSGARHQGHNGDVTQIGNAWFAWFSSTSSKRRINFLELLHAGDISYGLNTHALDDLHEQGLPQEPLPRLEAQWPAGGISGAPCWEANLDALGIDSARHRRFATEGTLLGGLIDKGFSLDLVIVSDGAGQFAIPLHTNGSENDIRGYVKWRKVSGGTRSALGKQCRDTFASLKKPCRKLGIAFWGYLTDRIEQHGAIPPLPDSVRERALAAAGP